MMFLARFTLRRMVRYWFMGLLVLAGLSAAAAFLAGLPTYATAIAARSLDQVLSSASPAAKNLQLFGPPELMSAALFSDVDRELGDLMLNRLDTRQTGIVISDFDWTQIEEAGELNVESLYQIEEAVVWSSTTYWGHIRVVDGRLPTYLPPATRADMLRPPKMEAVIGLDVHELTGIDIGDRFVARGGESFTVVGIVESVDAESEVWWGGAINPFEARIAPKNLNEDIITVPLIISFDTMSEVYPGHSLNWYVLLDPTQINVNTIEELQRLFRRLTVILDKSRVSFSSGLPSILENFQHQIGQTKRTLLLLSSQAFIFILYMLAMLTSFYLDQSRTEIATLVSRGAGRMQLLFVFAFQGALLAFPAGLWLGPLLAKAVLEIWLRLSGINLSVNFQMEARLLAGAAAFVGWLAYIVPVIPATKVDLLDLQSKRARAEQLAGWQKKYLDIFLLLIGGLAYWQLSQSGTFIMNRLGQAGETDPFLLIGPTLLLVAIGLIFLRIFPIVLRIAAAVSKWNRGLVFPMGFERLSRAPIEASKVVLLVSVAAGLTFFANTFEESLRLRQEEISRYMVGADLTISLYDAPFDSLLDLKGVRNEARLFRSRLSVDGPSSEVTLVGVDFENFSNVSGYPAGISPVSMQAVVNTLGADEAGQWLPAVYSNPALPRGSEIGDRPILSLFGQPVLVEIRGNILEFPTLNGQYILVDLAGLEDRVSLIEPPLDRGHQLWLDIEPEAYEEIIALPELQGRILGDAQKQLDAMRSDTFSKGALGAFRLNAIILVCLSIVGFWLVNYFAVQRRRYEFGIMRSMGLDSVQVFGLLTVESVLVVLMGLGAGVGIGYGLSQSMRPFLARALRAALTGASTIQTWIDYPQIAQTRPVSFGGQTLGYLTVNWGELGLVFVNLAAFFALAMLILLLTLLRSGVHRVLRIGEE